MRHAQSVPSAFSRLNAPLGATFGRAEEIRRASSALESARVVSLTGPLGVGKSHVAACVGAAYGAQHAVATWVYAVGSEPALDDALRRMDGHAGEGAALLHIDGAESDSAQAEELCAQWLNVDPERKVLVSTRETSARFGGEAVTLRPLSVDDGVALFVQRARSAGVDIPEAAYADVAAIVGNVDGLPLAIELCAAQTLVFDVAALRRHFATAEARLDAADGGGSLRHVIGAAVELLSAEERDCFSRCGLLTGTFAFESAQAVTGATLAVWQTLCARGWIQPVDMARGRRFRLYGPLRDYAQTRDACASARPAHRTYYSSPASIDDDERAKNLIAAAAERTNADDHDTARALLVVATAAAQHAGQIQAMLIQWDAVWPATPRAEHWSSRGQLRLAQGDLVSAQNDLDAACADLDGASPSMVATTLIARATARRFAGDAAGAALDYRAALAETDVPPATRALAHERFGGHLLEQQEREEAATHLQHARGRYAAIGDMGGAARVQQALGVLAQEAGDWPTAEAAFTAAKTAHLRLGHARFAAIAQFDLGALTLEQGAPRRAEALLSDAAAQLDAAGDRRQAAFARALIAVCVAARGAAAEAAALLDQAADEAVRNADPGYAQAIEMCRGLVTGHASERDRALHQAARNDEGRYVQRLFSADAASSTGEHQLEISENGEVIRLSGVRVVLKSQAARRILAALGTHRQAATAETLSSAALYAAGWPGDKTLTDAANNRLQVALSALRKSGLRDVIERVGAGYRLTPSTRVRIVQAASKT